MLHKVAQGKRHGTCALHTRGDVQRQGVHELRHHVKITWDHVADFGVCALIFWQLLSRAPRREAPSSPQNGAVCVGSLACVMDFNFTHFSCSCTLAASRTWSGPTVHVAYTLEVFADPYPVCTLTATTVHHLIHFLQQSLPEQLHHWMYKRSH